MITQNGTIVPAPGHPPRLMLPRPRRRRGSQSGASLLLDSSAIRSNPRLPFHDLEGPTGKDRIVGVGRSGDPASRVRRLRLPAVVERRLHRSGLGAVARRHGADAGERDRAHPRLFRRHLSVEHDLRRPDRHGEPCRSRGGDRCGAPARPDRSGEAARRFKGRHLARGVPAEQSGRLLRQLQDDDRCRGRSRRSSSRRALFGRLRDGPARRQCRPRLLDRHHRRRQERLQRQAYLRRRMARSGGGQLLVRARLCRRRQLRAALPRPRPERRRARRGVDAGILGSRAAALFRDEIADPVLRGFRGERRQAADLHRARLRQQHQCRRRSGGLLGPVQSRPGAAGEALPGLLRGLEQRGERAR